MSNQHTAAKSHLPDGPFLSPVLQSLWDLAYSAGSVPVGSINTSQAGQYRQPNLNRITLTCFFSRINPAHSWSKLFRSSSNIFRITKRKPLYLWNKRALDECKIGDEPTSTPPAGAVPSIREAEMQCSVWERVCHSRQSRKSVCISYPRAWRPNVNPRRARLSLARPTPNELPSPPADYGCRPLLTLLPC